MRKIENLEKRQQEYVCKIIDAKQPIVIFSDTLTKEKLHSLIAGKVKCDKIEWFDCKQTANFADLLPVLKKENVVIVLENFDVLPSSCVDKEDIEVLFSKIAKNDAQNNEDNVVFSFEKNNKSVIFLSRKDVKGNSETNYNQFDCPQTTIPFTEEIIKEILIKSSKQVLEEKEQFDSIANKSGQIFSGEENKRYENLTINNSPHLFVLCCLMERQMNAKKAWQIPLEVCTKTGRWSIDELSEISLDEMKKIFEDNHLHRFNNKMAKVFFDAVERIKEQYDKDASKIWKGNLTSAEVVNRFLEFNGAGIKIATMAANILQRDFGVEFSGGLEAIDASPDVHVRRVLYRLGFTEDENNANMAVDVSKAINPKFPGLIDYPCWLWGQTYCDPQSPKCEQCPMAAVCISSLEKCAEGKIE